MTNITFFDTEIEPKSRRILDIGSVKPDGSFFHSASISDFVSFIKGSEFICGHNIIRHDLKYTHHALQDAGISPFNVIDTLSLSPLLFPARPYHALLKDDKLQADELNNPKNDAQKAMDLFFDEVSAFNSLDANLKAIYFYLLSSTTDFSAFFRYLAFKPQFSSVAELILLTFSEEICTHAYLSGLIDEHPVELAYCLALINARNRYSITPRWVLRNYPYVEKVMYLLRNKPCLTGCDYCNKGLNVHLALKKYLGFDTYRSFGGEPLQEKAVKAAVDGKSILTVFPTGGGKSITFQVPALMAGEAAKALTVVISPLQSLMKDQVDNLEKMGITDAVTISGLLDPIERAKSFERVADGLATILYISPESLRSKTIERLLLGRKIARIVIDEAHCFSSWGQDFRVDYLYIGDFIQSIQTKKNLSEKIPVSCFTATAKQKVIEDIRNYFKEKLSLELDIFKTNASRTNLHYQVFSRDNEEEKYETVRDLIADKECATIVYVSRTRKAYDLANRLTSDGFPAKPYYGKMDRKEKSENQDAFLSGSVQIMVATSAFGMGVDKKDIGMVIHYEISDSLENYIQEAGRAGRDENITADCYVLFNEEDLSKHFILLNQTKLNINEIKQIWNAIKFITKFRTHVAQSALEIARKAGWDDSIGEIETRVTTAIAALEDAGYLVRGQNEPRVFANSILARTAQEAIDKILGSNRFRDDVQKQNAIRIIKKLISTKNRKSPADEVAESRVDYISEHLGVNKKEVIAIINILREEKILSDAKDLMAFIKKGENVNRSLSVCELYRKIENFLISQTDETEKTFNLKELNQLFEQNTGTELPINKLKTIINFWAIKNWIKRQYLDYSHNHVTIHVTQPISLLKEKLENRHILSGFISEYLYNKLKNYPEPESEKEEVLVEFSVQELKKQYKQQNLLFTKEINYDDVEDALFYLSRIDAIKIEGGFLVVYNKLTIDRKEQNNRIQYKAEDYQKLDQYYNNKTQQIHIVGEYAKKMSEDYRQALLFVDDYFQLNYNSFLNKYFPGTRQLEITRNITPKKYRQLFEELSEKQREVIDDKNSTYIVVAAGPGSGKTKLLVHKLASLLLMEDVKHEQLLMVTFSRAAATEFKKRLIGLIGNAACFVEIKTFHSYCFDLLGKVGSLEKSDTIIQTAIERIRNKEVEENRITKTVLVIDEAQDMDIHEYSLVSLLMEKNPEMRVIAVGDDDQNIYAFRGSDSKHFISFITRSGAKKYDLLHNYRSSPNLVDFANQFVGLIPNRLKTDPIQAVKTETGIIRITKHFHSGLITPLVSEVISTDLSGSTCILTSTNDEAFQIAGALNKAGTRAKLIQSNDEISLYNLFEVRTFIDILDIDESTYIISDDEWQKAKEEIIRRFKRSIRLDVIVNLIKDFEAINPRKKFRSDLETFIYESKLEDFISGSTEVIFVSTMHKSKGREFDNVFLLLDNFDISDTEKKRQLYVAITRAKKNLYIQYNGDYFSSINVKGLEYIEDRNMYDDFNAISLHLTHRDLYLGYFAFVQHRINTLVSGDELTVSAEGCTNTRGELILKFSKSFLQKLEQYKVQGLIPAKAAINYIVYWKPEDSTKEFRIVLPEINLSKSK